jgi:hypothetical protein
MHPSPAALAKMTTAELTAYRDELRREMFDRNDDGADGPYMIRCTLIDAIISDRKVRDLPGAAPMEFVVRLFADDGTWFATLDYGRTEPTIDAVRAKIAEYNATTATIEWTTDGWRTRNVTDLGNAIA